MPTVPIGVLFSGGIDSAVVLHRLLAQGRGVLPLYCRGGCAWEATELYWLRRFLRAVRSSPPRGGDPTLAVGRPHLAPLRIIELPLRSLYGAHWSLTGRGVPGPRSADAAVYLPGRNVLLLSHAAIVCARRGISSIALGILKGNPFDDASPRFLARLAGSLSLALRRPIRVFTPLRHSTKREILRSAMGVPLELTFSCLRPRGRLHCGRCNKCAERRRAFRHAGLPDPTAYAR